MVAKAVVGGGDDVAMLESENKLVYRKPKNISKKKLSWHLRRNLNMSRRSPVHCHLLVWKSHGSCVNCKNQWSTRSRVVGVGWTLNELREKNCECRHRTLSHYFSYSNQAQNLFITSPMLISVSWLVLCQQVISCIKLSCKQGGY